MSNGTGQGGSPSFNGPGYYWFSKLGSPDGSGEPRNRRGEDVFVYVPNRGALRTTLRGMRGLGFNPINDNTVNGVTKFAANRRFEEMRKDFPNVRYSVVGGPGDERITRDWKNNQRRTFSQSRYQQQVQGSRPGMGGAADAHINTAARGLNQLRQRGVPGHQAYPFGQPGYSFGQSGYSTPWGPVR